MQDRAAQEELLLSHNTSCRGNRPSNARSLAQVQAASAGQRWGLELGLRRGRMGPVFLRGSCGSCSPVQSLGSPRHSMPLVFLTPISADSLFYPLRGGTEVGGPDSGSRAPPTPPTPAGSALPPRPGRRVHAAWRPGAHSSSGKGWGWAAAPSPQTHIFYQLN